MSKCRIFVYGTLRTGFGNNHLIKRQTFIGTAVTRNPRFILIDSFGLPFVVKAGKTSKHKYRIAGEVWEIDMPTLAAVDVLESNGTLYQREKIRTSVGRAWMYLGITDTRGFLGLVRPDDDIIAPADQDGIQTWDPVALERRQWERFLSEQTEEDRVLWEEYLREGDEEDADDIAIPFKLDDPEDDHQVIHSRDWTGAPR